LKVTITPKTSCIKKDTAESVVLSALFKKKIISAWDLV
jgi:hypothetical protein